jgi:hypothetical protein
LSFSFFINKKAADRMQFFTRLRDGNMKMVNMHATGEDQSMAYEEKSRDELLNEIKRLSCELPDWKSGRRAAEDEKDQYLVKEPRGNSDRFVSFL